MKFRGKTLLAKLQPDPGVDPEPAGANAIQTEDLEIQPYEGNTIERERDRVTLGAFPTINTSPMVQMSFNCDFSGAGDSVSPDQAPGYSPLIRACGMAEEIDNTASEEKVIYTPVSEDFEEVALYYLRQAILHKALNCKGNVQIQLATEQLPQFQFSDFMGYYLRPEPPPEPAIEPAAEHFIDSVAVTKVNTPVFEINGESFGTPFAPCVNSFNFNLGNTVAWKDEPNCRGSIIEDRRSSGEIVLEAPNPSNRNLFEFLESHQGVTLLDFHVQHGTQPGNIVEVILPAVQLLSLQETEQRGELYYTIGYNALPDTGDDEIQIIVR